MLSCGGVDCSRRREAPLIGLRISRGRGSGRDEGIHGGDSLDSSGTDDVHPPGQLGHGSRRVRAEWTIRPVIRSGVTCNTTAILLFPTKFVNFTRTLSAGQYSGVVTGLRRRCQIDHLCRSHCLGQNPRRRAGRLASSVGEEVDLTAARSARRHQHAGTGKALCEFVARPGGWICADEPERCCLHRSVGLATKPPLVGSNEPACCFTATINLLWLIRT